VSVGEVWNRGLFVVPYIVSVSLLLPTFQSSLTEIPLALWGSICLMYTQCLYFPSMFFK
jgi:hypothetical protein